MGNQAPRAAGRNVTEPLRYRTALRRWLCRVGAHRLPHPKKIEIVTTLREGLSEAEKKAFVLAANFQRRNLSPDQKSELRAKQVAIAAELKEEGKTQGEIALALGISQQAVAKWLMPNTTSGKAHKPKPDNRVKVLPKQRPELLERGKVGEIARRTARPS